MSDTIVKVSDLYFSYPSRKDIKVLEHICFSVGRGEAVGIIGANGAGKSTLLRILTGLIEADTGNVEIEGMTLEKKNFAQIRQKLAYVFQDSQNQLFLTKVRDELAFAPDNYRYSKEKKEKKIQEAVKITGIEKLLDRQVFHLSGGERKLVAIASVLTTEPSILLMDEPSAALDPVNRRNLIQLLNRLPEAKIITSHDLDMIWDTCTRVILMNKGSIVADGPVREILSDGTLLEKNGLEMPLRLQSIQ